jgi:hypothetical protein
VWSHGREKKKHTHGDYDGSGLRNEKTPANQPSTLSQMREERERERDTMRRTAAAAVAATAFFFPSSSSTALQEPQQHHHQQPHITAAPHQWSPSLWPITRRTCMH